MRKPGRRLGPIVRRLRARIAKAEDGVILVLWTLGLTALAGFLALVLDWGNGVQTATNVQSAADVAAVAAVGPASFGGYAAATSEVLSVALKYGYCSGGTTCSGGDFDVDWNSCNNDVPSGFMPEPGSNCVAFSSDTAGNTVIWVEIPVQVASLFGSIGGGGITRYAYAVSITPTDDQFPSDSELCYMTPSPGNC
jgi:uncharacterized membrane protein